MKVYGLIFGSVLTFVLLGFVYLTLDRPFHQGDVPLPGVFGIAAGLSALCTFGIAEHK